ncbi:homeobox protein ESX1-like [Hordeum vulgare subsp. vulgare]|uniref:homeobox protein ESX1-like n=1 Tax=Hordeum vulgare subsp. vulgare TaxID=112509 RepID=UPI001D1A3485|nr:homeobox protein ESX1-like [Hordeum vulgare subsp. vulgare]
MIPSSGELSLLSPNRTGIHTFILLAHPSSHDPSSISAAASVPPSASTRPSPPRPAPLRLRHARRQARPAPHLGLLSFECPWSPPRSLPPSSPSSPDGRSIRVLPPQLAVVAGPFAASQRPQQPRSSIRVLPPQLAVVAGPFSASQRPQQPRSGIRVLPPQLAVVAGPFAARHHGEGYGRRPWSLCPADGRR